MLPGPRACGFISIPSGVISQGAEPLVQGKGIQITNAAGKSTLVDDKMLKTLPRRKVEIKDKGGMTAV